MKFFYFLVAIFAAFLSISEAQYGRRRERERDDRYYDREDRYNDRGRDNSYYDRDDYYGRPQNYDSNRRSNPDGQFDIAINNPLGLGGYGYLR